MHEWALANAVVKSLSELYEKGFRGRVEVVLGELQSIDLEVFKLALNTLIEEEGVRGVEYDIVTEEAEFKCRRCGGEWRLKDLKLSSSEIEAIHFLPEAVHAIVKCPYCGSRDYSIVRGRGVYIRVGGEGE